MKVLWTIVFAAAARMSSANKDTGKRSNLRGDVQLKNERDLAFSASNEGTSDTTQSIVGGSVAAARPWFVQGWGCGGTLIWKDFVLTAAHCYDPDPNLSPFAAGDTVYIGNTQSRTLTSGAETRTVKQVIRHPSYDSQPNAYDYMLVQLTSTVSSTRTLATYNSDSTNPLAGAMLTTMGFGTTSSGGQASNTLLEVSVKTYSQTYCNTQYGGDIVESVMFCAGADAGGKDSCQGDSGGPIVDSNNVLVGVVSFGIGCGDANYPGVYSRVSAAKSWIDQNLCAYSAVKPCSCTNSCTTTSATKAPTKKPTKTPTKKPITKAPTKRPTKLPTKAPTKKPTKVPTKKPTTKAPTKKPVAVTATTKAPTKNPTKNPTRVPTKKPTTKTPTKKPTTKAPTKRPTKAPTKKPSLPTYAPVATTWDDYWVDDTWY